MGDEAAPTWTVEGSAWMEAVAALPPDDEVTPGTGVSNRDYLACMARPVPDPPGAVYERDVVYGTVAGRDLTLELFRRADVSESQPAVVFVHGGGWAAGDPWFHIRHAHALAAQGFVTMTIRYRLAGEAPYPAALEDAKCAVRWARANARALGADPGRIAVAGGSAGGQLAAMVALTPGRWEGAGGHAGVSSEVQAAVLWYPATDIVSLPAPEEFWEVLDPYFGDLKADASPVNHVSPACPPILTITGSVDALTTVALIRSFHDELDAANVQNRLEVFEGMDHAFDLSPGGWQASYDLLEAFLVETLSPPPAPERA